MLSFKQTRKIQRANLDGTDIEDIVTTGLNIPHYIAVDGSGGKIYWTDDIPCIIKQANLDRTNVESLVTAGLEWQRGIAVDVKGGKIYWADSDNQRIQRANLDSTNVEDLLGTRRPPAGIAVLRSRIGLTER